ncbi:hypothetical protein T265_10513 [Opisthorchis viverrini]|uniref:Uncharacterized protein n=1 Tax=Opisthorchis viverrini TaxID=6198 RepID=A0A075A120_OPIVI|nr:hypothetical protein T265_10513 [Opisthorchis viverrini]KER21099.1 hypothetical protein T265_10513 [Opisthorchis viverrini]
MKTMKQCRQPAHLLIPRMKRTKNRQLPQETAKDPFSDLLALAEDQPSAPAGSSKGSEDSLSPDALHRLTGASIGSDTGKRLSFSGRIVQIGRKGGHSLRNLDSRRAAEAERRQLPVAGGATKRSSRTSANQKNNVTSMFSMSVCNSGPILPPGEEPSCYRLFGTTSIHLPSNWFIQKGATTQ